MSNILSTPFPPHRAEKKEQERKRYEVIPHIAVFPGSIAEYESWRKYTVEIINTQRNDKGIRLTLTEQGEVYLRAPEPTIDLLVENGVEAIVNAVRTPHYRKTQAEQDYYGLPVRRKK